MEMISKDKLSYLAGKYGVSEIYIEKDFYLTATLYLIRGIKGLYFKGGTALYKIFLNHLRLSEDLDFSVKGDLRRIEKEIKTKLLLNSIFKEIKYDKRTKHFIRLIVSYTSLFGGDDRIILDLNKKAKVYLGPEKKQLKHFYKNVIPNFEINVLNIEELIAEKISAITQRYAPRDYYDVYNIINKKLPINMSLVKKKCEDAGRRFEVNRIFRRGQKIYNKWESDLLPLTRTKPRFRKVMRVLSHFFEYKGEENY